MPVTYVPKYPQLTEHDENLDTHDDSLGTHDTSLDTHDTALGVVDANVDTILAEVLEIEVHMHSPERWLGQHPSPTSTVFAEANETAYQIDSGNTVFGAWLQILGTDDTPVIAGKAFFDFHRILITDHQETTMYRIQIAYGADADVAFAAENYTEIVVKFSVGQVKPAPFVVQDVRCPSGTEIWARCRCASNTGTLDFMIGLHEYDS